MNSNAIHTNNADYALHQL